MIGQGAFPVIKNKVFFILIAVTAFDVFGFVGSFSIDCKFPWFDLFKTW